jgi:hypothetical protein
MTHVITGPSSLGAPCRKEELDAALIMRHPFREAAFISGLVKEFNT